MATTLTLDPALRDAITDTVLASRDGTEPGGEGSRLRREILRDGIERAIADPEYFGLYMRHLDRVLSRPLPDSLRGLLPEDREETVLALGVGALRDDEVDRMALSPYQMSQVQRALFECPEIPASWVGAIDRAMDLSLRECDASRRGIEEVVDAAFLASEVVRPRGGSRFDVMQSDESGLALAAFGMAREPDTGPAARVLAWIDEAPFASLEILAVHNLQEVELRRRLAIQIEYRWQSVGDHGSALSVWLGGSLVLTGADCTARLLDALGAEQARASIEEHTLTFSLPDVDRPNSLVGWTVAGDYHKGNFVDARFSLVLRPPVEGLAPRAE